MKKWEYHIESFLTASIEEMTLQTEYQKDQRDEFNYLGDNGWELVAIHELSNSEKCAVFKKEKIIPITK